MYPCGPVELPTTANQSSHWAPIGSETTATKAKPIHSSPRRAASKTRGRNGATGHLERDVRAILATPFRDAVLTG